MQMGIAPGGLIPVWTLREVLETSGLCLSKMHIHVRTLQIHHTMLKLGGPSPSPGASLRGFFVFMVAGKDT